MKKFGFVNNIVFSLGENGHFGESSPKKENSNNREIRQMRLELEKVKKLNFDLEAEKDDLIKNRLEDAGEGGVIINFVLINIVRSFISYHSNFLIARSTGKKLSVTLSFIKNILVHRYIILYFL